MYVTSRPGRTVILIKEEPRIRGALQYQKHIYILITVSLRLKRTFLANAQVFSLRSRQLVQFHTNF